MSESSKPVELPEGWKITGEYEAIERDGTRCVYILDDGRLGIDAGCGGCTAPLAVIRYLLAKHDEVPRG